MQIGPFYVAEGILEVDAGGKSYTLVYTRKQRRRFAQLLGGKDPLGYVGDGGSQDEFLIQGFIAGLSRDGQYKGMTSGTVEEILDQLAAEIPDFDEDDLAKAMMWAVAESYTKSKREKILKALAESFMLGGGTGQNSPLPAPSASEIEMSST